MATKKKSKNKYTYYLVIQENWGQGWEDADFHEANSQGVAKNRDEFKANKKAYRENSKAPQRVIFRKEKN